MDNVLFCIRFKAVRSVGRGVIVEYRNNADSYDEAHDIAWKELAGRKGYNPNEWTFHETRVIFKVTREQYKKLEELAHLITESAYIKERAGEANKNADTAIRELLNECDNLSIPSFVQKAVIEFARNRKWYKSERLTSILEVIK